ncbi:unnamed protein product [Thelazia callipaeda]|uniref:MFS domain-containing protein n=1 Tax=Thelazia callipaeda TaxID=103827 RepID=A0A158RCV0_THECL|nr:unnamed protein product [Thelazia callipaeda]
MVRVVPSVSEITANIDARGDLAKNCDKIMRKESKRTGIYSKFRYLLTVRMLIAVLMSFCFIALSVTTTNLTGSLVCMVFKEDKNAEQTRILRYQHGIEEWMNGTYLRAPPCLPQELLTKDMKLSFGDRPDPSRLSKRSTDKDNNYVEIRSCYVDERLNWTMFEQGMVLSAQNVGSLLMLIIGPQADRINGKWTVAAALLITVLSNLMLPLLAAKHLTFAICARILCGVADALLSPSISSMIARWFPPKERPFAIGFITGGRQIGLIFTFHLCAWCNDIGDMTFGLQERKERESTPWKELLTSGSFIAGIFAVVCQEYPLVITTTATLPLLALWVSKNLSSSLSSFLSARKSACCLMGRTSLVKLFNGMGSAGLALGLVMIPFLKHSVPALIAVSAANAFAGLHTPGVFTALLQIAPAYTGSVTGIAYSAGHIANWKYLNLSIVNKLTNGLILRSWSASAGQWEILYGISAVIAFLPVVFFSLWGSADLQPWAVPKLKQSLKPKKTNTNLDKKEDFKLNVLPSYMAESLPVPV